ncbi:hypothetical protein BO78DRAFT_416026 [Aspergillus sclerotiicarbonarius CBS 121057]|uniref:Transposase IS30-like HTH domain-containing protein n=1 Tax=Aspergillus sclerotiicarbonarius (strain CBS 121057 / IBT 28362) TaxID=1448318 RepID=A0A319FL96_ASPSB|nr:hypothetical protein BO78DRAFT_416026 [Aspergillus sclerotiicarbonarius CBS 121057]
MDSPTLQPPDPNFTRGRELKPEDRAYIMKLYHEGVRPSEIARQLKRSPQTIHTTIRRCRTRDDYSSQPRSGRPKVTNDRIKRRIIRYIRTRPLEMANIIKESGYDKEGARKRAIFEDAPDVDEDDDDDNDDSEKPNSAT